MDHDIVLDLLGSGGIGGAIFLAVWFWLQNKKNNKSDDEKNNNHKEERRIDIHDIKVAVGKTEKNLEKLSEVTLRIANNAALHYEKNLSDHDRLLAAVNRIEAQQHRIEAKIK